MKRTLTEQYGLIKKGKGHKDVFLKEAKKLYPNLIRPGAAFNEASTILKQKNIINENFVGMEPINNPFEAKKKEGYETAFENFLKEAAEAKAVEKKVSKEVEEDQSKAYDNRDEKNPNNMIFGQIQMGYYCELKNPKNADKTDTELLDIVHKNLTKDPIYYTKNGQFGEEGIGYTDDNVSLGIPKEAKGPHKSSGYGTLKENKYTEFVDDGENKYIDFNYTALEKVLNKYGKTSDDLEDWLNDRDIEIEPTDKEAINWLRESKPLKEHSVSMAGGIVTGGGFVNMNYMDYFGLNEAEGDPEDAAKVADETERARDAAKEISDMELFQEDDLNSNPELIDLDTGPDEDMSVLATAAEDAYDSGMEIEEIIEFIRQHLGLKFGDY